MKKEKKNTQLLLIIKEKKQNAKKTGFHGEFYRVLYFFIF